MAGTQPGSPDRELAYVRLSNINATLECSLAAACIHSRNATPLADDVALTEMTAKTTQYCTSLKNEYPRSKRQCP